ncbi:MAG: hypothetical protein ACOZAO_01715 [Patescibacteria group bacterium]
MTTQNQAQNQRQSPNLLNQNSFESDFVTKSHRQIISASKLMIIVVEIAFVLALALNATADNSVAKLQLEVSDRQDVVTGKILVEQKTNHIVQKLNKYTTQKNSRKLLGNRIDFLLNTLPGELKVEELAITEEQTIMKLEAESALSFSLLINKYFESGLVEQIILNSARLNTSSNTFIVDIELVFK